MKRGSGVLLHISCLPSVGGIGDLGPEAYRFADMLAQARQRYWQMLPLNPSNPENGESPYFSSSAFAGNPLLISLERLADQGLISADDISPDMRASTSMVNYPAVRKTKIAALEKAFAAFRSKEPDEPYIRFCWYHGEWIDDYALFVALKRRFEGRVWSEWPEGLKNRHPEALRQAASELSNDIAREKFLQYLFFMQWTALRSYCNAKSIEIIGDLPIYVSYDSADVWAHPEFFKLDGDKRPVAVSGVPPDYFSTTGQLWNNPVYNWEVLRADRYTWWTKRMKALFEYFDIVRIDHFRGLVHYWEVPAGSLTAITGSWQSVPTYDFFDALLNYFPQFPVIAEDLGLITPDVHEAMHHYGFPGMKILMFAFDQDDPHHPYLPHEFERNCIVYTGTHDNDTMKSWLQKADQKMIGRISEYLGRALPAEETIQEFIRIAMMSAADVAIFPLQDLLMLGNEARMNNPAAHAGNWLWRCPRQALDQFPAEKLRSMATVYGRAPLAST
jgi:4-alpha-glucanotransferase